MLAAMATLVLACVPARAATVTTYPTYETVMTNEGGSVGYMTVEGPPRFAVTGDPTAAESLRVEGDTITSLSQPIRVERGCVQESEVRVRCAGLFGALTVGLGGGDDELTVVGGPSAIGRAPFITGGDGDDRIVADVRAEVTGGPGADTIVANATATVDGGAGEDDITATSGNLTAQGGAGRDRIIGGAGNDELDGGPGPDVLDGGPGTDTVDWAAATGPVVADLARPELPAGDVADPDRITGIENVKGGTHGNTLSGDERANRLQGGAGDDRIAGLAGADVLDGGGGGEDLLLGGDGNDRLDNAERVSGGRGDDVLAGDRPSCGPGADVVEVASYGSRPVELPVDCERVTDDANAFTGPGRLAAPARPLVIGALATLTLTPGLCDTRCTARVTLAEAGNRRRLGAASIPIATGVRPTRSIRLARPLCRATRVRVHVDVRQLGVLPLDWVVRVVPRPSSRCGRT